MSSKENPSPIEPQIGSKGRAIADRWAIRILMAEMKDLDQLLSVSALLSCQRAQLSDNIDETLRTELDTDYVAQLNTPLLQKECSDRVQYLIDEISAIVKRRQP